MRLKKLFFGFLVILWLGLFFQSCLNRQFVKGKSELVSISDTTLNDLSIIVGHVYNLPNAGVSPAENVSISIIETGQTAVTDAKGFYQFIVKPGVYKIRTKDVWPQLVEEANIELAKNKKVKVDFYLGYTIE